MPPHIYEEPVDGTTCAESCYEADGAGYTKELMTDRAVRRNPELHLPTKNPEPDATPIQIWEGVVTDVDWESNAMHAYLEAKIGDIPRHAVEINLEWVSAQDLDLVRPGAVFYLELYKRTTRGSVTNAQELRFRRLPAWSKKQTDRLYQKVGDILANFAMAPMAE